MHDHEVLHAFGPSLAEIAILLGLLAVLATYVLAARRASRSGRTWPRGRAVVFSVGVGLLALGLLPPVSAWAHAGFAGHALQHLLIGMVAPIALVLGAPVTLLLRTVQPRTGRRIGRVLRSGPVHLLTRPATALLLSAGGLYVLYLTPLYNASTAQPLLHAAISAHFLLAGCLFAWVIAGPDPAPRRPSVNVRLVTLGVAIVLHASLSQLMYADALVDIAGPADQLRAGATLMYYGGDLAELLLAVALLVTVRRRTTRSNACRMVACRHLTLKYVAAPSRRR